MQKRALFQGRFQPVTIGHASALAAILEEWERVTIGVVYNSPRPAGIDPSFEEYLDRVDRESYGEGRNPFTAEEVRSMWESYIWRKQLAARVNCTLVKRLEFELELNSVFPPSEIDFVWPRMTENDAETDAWRHALYPRVLKREIHYVAPQLKLHNSEIRRRVRAHADWEKFIPEGAYDVFCRLHGPARMEDAIKLRMAHT